MRNIYKFFTILLTLTLCISSMAMAQISVRITDSAANKLSVSGSANEGSRVMLFILSDGCSYSDLISGTKDAVIYADDCIADANGYSFDVELDLDRGSDNFTAWAGYDNIVDSASFIFYPDSVKLGLISSLATGDIAYDDISECMKTFTIEFELYDSKANLEIAKVLTGLRDELGGFELNNEGKYDIDKFIDLVKSAIAISAINTDDSRMFDKNGALTYAELLAIDSLAEYSDYNTGITSDGISNVKKAIMTGSYINKSQLKAAFKKAVYANLITQNTQWGSAFLADVFKKYETEYINAGFELGKRSNLTDKQLGSVYSALVDSKKTDLGELASLFNSKVKNPDSEGGTVSNPPQQSSNTVLPGSGGNGSAGVGTSSGMGYIEPPKSEAGVGGFGDVSDSFWAYDYIKILSDSGIINGYGDGSFKPDSSITRAEFVKIIITAMGIEINGEKCDFEDAADMWASPYIAIAVKEGIVSGISDTHFAPDSYITREQASTLIARAIKADKYNMEDKFSDNDNISEWARTSVYALRERGIISGYGDGSFEPAKQLSRAEASKLIVSAYKLQ